MQYNANRNVFKRCLKVSPTTMGIAWIFTAGDSLLAYLVRFGVLKGLGSEEGYAIF